jgi:glycosyltransferase involved in cell wall biosynthesis
MRILVFNWRDITHPWAGGAELNIHEQAKHWVKENHSVTLFCGEYAGSSRQANIEGINIIRRGGRFTVYLWAIFYYFWFFRDKFDIIIDIENGIPFFTPLYTRLPKVCIIHHVHTEQFHTEFSPPLSWIGVYLESTVMPIVYKRVTFITISEGSHNDLVGIGIDPERCSVVYCGLDHVSLHPGNPKTNFPSLVYLGRLMRYKRVGLLINFMEPILREYPNAVLNILGSGPDIKNLMQIVKDKKLENNVVFHGYVSEERKIKLLQESWIMVIASMKEGWGLVILEANACGTPAIAFNVSGICEAIENSKSGLLVDNEGEFVETTCMLLRDHDLRSRLSIGAIERSKAFNWEIAAAQTLHILFNLVNKNKIVEEMTKYPKAPINQEDL